MWQLCYNLLCVYPQCETGKGSIQTQSSTTADGGKGPGKTKRTPSPLRKVRTEMNKAHQSDPTLNNIAKGSPTLGFRPRSLTFRYVASRDGKFGKSDLKKPPDLSHLGPIWPTLEPNLPSLVARDVRFMIKVGHISLKWDKSRTCSEQFSIHWNLIWRSRKIKSMINHRVQLSHRALTHSVTD